MGDQRVDQCAALVPGGGMHHEVLRLVEHDDVVVLEYDIKRNVLAFGLGRNGGRHVDCDRISGGDMVGGVANRRAADAHLARENERLEARTRQVGAARRQRAVQPRARLAGGQRQFAALAMAFGSMAFGNVSVVRIGRLVRSRAAGRLLHGRNCCTRSGARASVGVMREAMPMMSRRPERCIPSRRRFPAAPGIPSRAFRDCRSAFVKTQHGIQMSVV